MAGSQAVIGARVVEQAGHIADVSSAGYSPPVVNVERHIIDAWMAVAGYPVGGTVHIETGHFAADHQLEFGVIYLPMLSELFAVSKYSLGCWVCQARHVQNPEQELSSDRGGIHR